MIVRVDPSKLPNSLAYDRNLDPLYEGRHCFGHVGPIPACAILSIENPEDIFART